MSRNLLRTAAMAALLLTAISPLAACGDDGQLPPEQEQEQTPQKPQTPEGPQGSENQQTPENPKEEEQQDMSKIKITAGGRSFTADLADTAAAKAFAEKLPLTLEMSELNGNEKYHYLDFQLPTSASNPGRIQTGDIMLYGNSCVVVFYKTFSTSYSYTRLGRIADADGLESALGKGSATVTFETAE